MRLVVSKELTTAFHRTSKDRLRMVSKETNINYLTNGRKIKINHWYSAQYKENHFYMIKRTMNADEYRRAYNNLMFYEG